MARSKQHARKPKGDGGAGGTKGGGGGGKDIAKGTAHKAGGDKGKKSLDNYRTARGSPKPQQQQQRGSDCRPAPQGERAAGRGREDGRKSGGRGGGRGKKDDDRKPVSADQLDAEMDTYWMKSGNKDLVNKKLDEEMDAYWAKRDAATEEGGEKEGDEATGDNAKATEGSS